MFGPGNGQWVRTRTERDAKIFMQEGESWRFDPPLVLPRALVVLVTALAVVGVILAAW